MLSADISPAQPFQTGSDIRHDFVSIEREVLAVSHNDLPVTDDRFARRQPARCTPGSPVTLCKRVSDASRSNRPG